MIDVGRSPYRWEAPEECALVGTLYMCVYVKSTGKRESFPSVPPAFIGPKHVEKRAGHALGTRRARVPKACCQTRVGTRVGQLRTCLLCRSFLRVLGPKGAERPTVGLPNVGFWVLSYVARSYNSLLSSPYFYVQKSVGISNNMRLFTRQRRELNDDCCDILLSYYDN